MSGARRAAALVLACFFIGAGLAAQPSSELHRTVDRILRYTTIDGLTGNAAESFMNHLREVAPDLTADEEARLEGPVQKAFAATRLRDGITDHVAREATDELAALVLNWQERGAPARVREVLDSFDPPLTIWGFNREMNERRGLPEPEYERRPGQWYTEMYRQAIAATIRRAAEDVVEELRRSRAGRR